MIVLKVKTVHTGPFKTIIEVLKDLIPETNIEFRNDEITTGTETMPEDDSEYSEVEESDEEVVEEDSSDDEEEEEPKEKKSSGKSGMKIMAVDNSKTVLVNLMLNADKFNKFICRKPQILTGVNLVKLHTLIDDMDKDDEIELYMEHNDMQYMNIKIRNPNNKLDKSDYKLKLYEIDHEDKKIPDISFDAVVTINSQYFNKLCKKMKKIGEFVEIKCMKNKIVFVCKDDEAEMKRELTTCDDEDEVSKITIQRSDESVKIIQGVYELKNLVLFSKCAPLCHDILLYMKNGYPLVIKYQVANLGRLLLCIVPIQGDNADDNYSDEDNYYSDEEVELIA